MHKSELMSKINEIVSAEDEFVERLAAIDLTTADHSHFPVTTFLRIKSGLRKLKDDSARHKEIVQRMSIIIAGDTRDEY